jgi:hypothetical protein
VRSGDSRAVELELWIACVRLLAVAFSIVEVGVIRHGYPAGYKAAAWAVTALFALGAVLLFVATKRAYVPVVGRAALVFDTALFAAYACGNDTGGGTKPGTGLGFLSHASWSKHAAGPSWWTPRS